MSIVFSQVGIIKGVNGGGNVLTNPTSLQFGPDGRLYVSEQNGTINAFTVAVQDGEYVAIDHEEIRLPDGNHAIFSLQNHDDQGNETGVANRQVTGLVVTGTADAPVLYVSSSNSLIASNGEQNLDTNSGVVTKLTWTGSEWDAVDIVRGLPRSEENHSVNGMVLSEDGTKLLVQIGGNTNNGAPSGYFSYTGEYVLSGTVIEIDLVAIDALPELVDPNGGKNNTPRKYVYDLPTLDDPNRENAPEGMSRADAIAAGFKEDSDGMDLIGPWGGNDGLNMAILPGDAPLRIYADGLRNAYDIAVDANGNLFTIDNGSNLELGADPTQEDGDDDGDGVPNEALNTPNLDDDGDGDREPLYRIDEGEYYGHPAPVRANQNLAWTVYDDNGNPDPAVSVNFVGDISALVPNGLDIPEGFLIHPSKFAAAPGQSLADLSPAEQVARLFESGTRIDRDNDDPNAITLVGSSTNGLFIYDSGGTVFGGAIDGALIVAQFNANITLLNLNAAGDGLLPVIDPGTDGVLGTADDAIVEGGEDGVISIANAQTGVSLGAALDVTQGPDGTIWIAEIASNEVTVLAPASVSLPDDEDADDDGIANVDDPFQRDPTNGTSVMIEAGAPVVFEFQQGAEDTVPGPGGYGGGLTGAMINGVTDVEAFFASERGPNEVQLDNVKFTTAALGGATVIESVSGGDALGSANDAEFQFQTGVVIGETVGEVTFTWRTLNPEASLTGPDQQIGGYIGTGDQSNYLKLVAIQDASGVGAFQILLEDGDTVAASETFGAGVFDAADAPADAVANAIELALTVDVQTGLATAVATYFTSAGPVTETGPEIDLNGTAVLDAVRGNNQVNGQEAGLAVGLYASNAGQDDANTFQATFDSITIDAEAAPDPTPTTEVNIVSGDQTVDEADGAAFVSILSSTTIESGGQVEVTFEIAPLNGAVPGTDYVYESNTATLVDGVYTDVLPIVGGSSDLQVPITILEDSLPEAPEGFSFRILEVSGPAILGSDAASVISIADNDDLGPGVVVYRVNAGGTEVQATDGGPNWAEDLTAVTAYGDAEKGTPSPFLVDRGLQGDDITFGNGAAGGANVTGAPDALFTTERFSSLADPNGLSYAFPVQDGVYTVNLFFDEMFFDEAGRRIFDVEIEGELVLDDFDPFAAAGNNTLLQAFTVEVTDGTLNLDFIKGAQNNPIINAIEIVALSPFTGGDPNTPPMVAAAIADQQVAADDPFSFTLPAGVFEDADGDVLTLTASLAGGGALPDWLGFDGTTFTGTPGAADTGALVIDVTADDGEATVTTGFLLTVDTPADRFNGVSAPSNDYADLNTAPDIITLQPGASNTLTVSQAFGDADYITIIVPEGQQLTSAVLTSYVGGANATFLGLQAGSSVPSQADIVSGSGSLDGGTVYAAADAGTDLLPRLASTVVEGAGQPVAGFDLPLGPGAYTLWFNQNQALSQSTIQFTTEDLPPDDSPPLVGEAVLEVTVKANNVQTSNFGNDSFVLTNTGTKTITAFEIDVTDAIFPDAVFDPFGLAGDTATKPLTINTSGGTGVIGTSPGSVAPYVGAGGIAGYEGLVIAFDPAVDNGFEPGESIGFSVDMDPNSIAGALKSILDSGTSPKWDVGGISGAELIGASFTVTFEDGSTATGKLHGANTQAGSKGIASQDSPNIDVALTVNGITEGGVGTYDDGGPTVIVNGPAGFTARVVLAQGIIQPTTNNFTGSYGDQLDAQLAALAASDFPANNAAAFQTVDIVLTGDDQDISDLFDFADAPGVALGIDESQLPLGFAAAVIDPSNSDLPLGPVSSPIHLVFGDGSTPDAAISIEGVTTTEIGDTGTTTLAFALSSSLAINGEVDVAFTAAGPVVNPPASPVTLTFENGTATLAVTVANDAVDNGTETVTLTLDGVSPTPGSSVANPLVLGDAVEATGLVLDDDAVFVEGDVLLRINAFGPELQATDGGPNWLADTAANPSAFFSSTQNRGDTSAAAQSGVAGVPDELFQLSRSSNGPINYDIPVADIPADAGVYKVNLYFIETAFGQDGIRVFDTALEGTVPDALDNLDPFAVFGNQLGGVISQTVTVTDGVLNISALPGVLSGPGGVQNPVISGVEIIEMVKQGFDISAVEDADTAANTVAENAIGATVGVTALASDETPGASVSYALTGANAGLFAIDGNGVITTAAALDREVQGETVDVTVQATSSAGGTASATFTVAVEDVNEAPVGAVSDVDGAENTVSTQAANGAAVGITAFASDPDATASSVTYALLSDADGRFTIDPTTGTVSVLDAVRVDGTDDSYAIEIEARSADGSTSTDTVTIAVTGPPPVDPGPAIGLGTTEIEGLDLTGYTVEDRSEASAGAVVRTSETGLAEGVFTGPGGVYDLSVDYFNESDGVATWVVLVNDVPVANWSGQGGTSVLGAPADVSFTGIALETGDKIAFLGTRGGGELARLDAVSIALSGTLNAAPELATPISDQGAFENALFDFSVPAGTFADADGDALTLSASLLGGEALPSWLGFDPATATFSGTPQAGDVGTITVEVTASDGEEIVRDRFEIVVTPEPGPGGATFTAGLTEIETLDLVGFTVEAREEASAGAVVRTLDTGLATATFTGAAGLYAVDVDYFNESDGAASFSVLVNGITVSTWTGTGGVGGRGSPDLESLDPIALETGDTVIFRAIKGGEELGRLDAVTLTAVDGGGGNNPPTLVLPVGDQSAQEGEAFSLTLPAGQFTDADGDPLTLSAGLTNGSPLPDWLGFDPATGVFSGTPGPGDARTLDIAVTASDGEDAAADVFTLDIAATGLGEGPFFGVGETEFETFDLDGYLIETRADASANALIRTFDTGSATATFNGNAGSYRFDITYFDESDGEASWQLRVNGEVVDAWTGTGGDGPLGTAAIRTIDGITLSPGDEIELIGTIGDADPSVGGAEELARLDKIAVIPEVANGLTVDARLAEDGSIDQQGQDMVALARATLQDTPADALPDALAHESMAADLANLSSLVASYRPETADEDKGTVFGGTPLDTHDPILAALEGEAAAVAEFASLLEAASKPVDGAVAAAPGAARAVDPVLPQVEPADAERADNDPAIVETVHDMGWLAL